MKTQWLTEDIGYMAGAFFMFYVVKGAGENGLVELGVSQLVPQVLHDFEAGAGGRPDVLVAPHGHFDHAGAASRWKKELPGARLCMSAAAAAALENPESARPYARAMSSISENPFFKDFYPLAEDDVFIEPVKTDSVLREGDEVEIGGEKLRVFETPGHSECSLSFLHDKSGTLFVSDACGLPLPSGRIWPTAFLDRVLYEKSLVKLMGLEPENLCTGHIPPMRDSKKIRRFFEKNLEAVDNFFSRIEALHAEFGEREAVLKALKEEYAKDAMSGLAWVIKYGNKEMVRQVIDGVRGRG